MKQRNQSDASMYSLFELSFLWLIVKWGGWTKTEICPKGNLIAFSLQVQEYLGPVLDDSGGNNIRFNCAEGNVLTGQSHDWGTFGKWSPSCTVGAICGLQTKVEDDQGAGDDTALNDVMFFCCD
ncbi:hypothetical protein JD844_033300 [Phrynosoma platyrhinos]|uniref:Vitelline membrane outer layer protein 1 homolog n=1 Tax=Phrynosoma platyrhinos TaxID=52577 RepID=A0ABQ7T7C7_PHRPL|nr:hypothetical protein JD844_033300 [Phrynosoma platyrhinos]